MENRIKQMKLLRQEGKLLREIGALFNLSRERVRQLIGNTGLINKSTPLMCIVCKRPFYNWINLRQRVCGEECRKIHKSNQKRKDQEQNRERNNIWRRNYMKKRLLDPEFKKRIQEKTNERRRRKYHSDPEWRKKCLLKTATWWKYKYYSDPEFRNKMLIYSKAHRKRKTDERTNSPVAQR